MVIVWLVLVACTIAVPTFAQTRSGLPIAFISVQRILTEAEDAKAAAKELEALRLAKGQELTAKRQALEQTKLAIANAGGYFSASKREQLKATEKTQEADLQQATQLAQTDFQELQKKLQSELRTELNGIVTALATQRGFLYVLNQDAALVLAPTGADLTAEVLTRLDAAAAQRAASKK